MKKQKLFGKLYLPALILLFSCSSNTGQQENPAGSGTEAVADGGQSTVNDNVSEPNVVKIAVGSPDHSTLVKAIQAAELVDALSNNGPFTVFAPTNAAFDQLPAGTLDNLMKKENKGTLEDILYNHVFVGVYNLKDFKDGEVLTLFGGNKAKFEVKDGKVTINGAHILASVKASNGVVHVIDAVLTGDK